MNPTPPCLDAHLAPFLAAILTQPEIDAPRLAFADWIEENGDRERAEWIRVQCELASLTERDEHFRHLGDRQRALLRANGERWWRPFAEQGIEQVAFRRGLVEALAVRVSTFVARGDALLAAAPLAQHLWLYHDAIEPLRGVQLPPAWAQALHLPEGEVEAPGRGAVRIASTLPVVSAANDPWRPGVCLPLRSSRRSETSGPRVVVSHPTGSEPEPVASLPFVVGVLADLSGQGRRAGESVLHQRFRDVERDSFADLMHQLAPRLVLTVPDRLGNGETLLRLELTFHSLADFGPSRVAGQLPSLHPLLMRRRALTEAPADRDERERLDGLLSAQVNEVLHHPDFQALESTWRGLDYLLEHTPVRHDLKVRVLDVSKQMLQRDCAKAVDFDQSGLFKNVYEEEFGRFGGEPFAVLLGAYAFDQSPTDMELLQGVAQTAACCQAIFLAEVSPRLFHINTWGELLRLGELAKHFQGVDYLQWRKFRESPESRHVALTVPRVLARLPYDPDQGMRAAVFTYRELSASPAHAQLLWMSAAWVYGVVLTRAFAEHGWLAHTRGLEGGGRVDGLASWYESADGGRDSHGHCTDLALSERLEFDLSQLGLLPLVHPVLRHPEPGYGVFFGALSCHRPEQYHSAEANERSRASCRIDYILCAAIFVRELQLMLRQRRGTLESRAQLQHGLNEWINGYVLAPHTAPEGLEQRARHPLASASIELHELRGHPGAHEVILILQLAYQFPEISPPLRLQMTFF